MHNIFSDNQTIRFLQQNLHKSKEVNIEINNWLGGLQGSEGVALVQEPNNHKGKLFGISKEYNTFTANTACSVRGCNYYN